MSAASDYLELKLLNHTFRNTPYVQPAAVYLALFTTATTDAGGGSEVLNANGYARQPAVFAAPVSPGGLMSLSASVVFPKCITSGWGTITNWGLFDAAGFGAGNLLAHGALTAPVAIAVDDVYVQEKLDITLA